MISTLQQTGRARFLALLALLLVLGLQSLEVSHSHADHDATVECLSCKSSSAGMASVTPALAIGECGALAPLVEETSAVRAVAFSLYDSRAPPHFS
jgi:hypothetical protein